MQRQKTIAEQKQHFLQTRKHYLSRGIVPSEKLKRIALDGGIELSVLKGALDKVNRDLKQHSRRVYSRQMGEHVVEQIDNFYWASGAPPLDAEQEDEDAAAAALEDDAHTVYQGDDLAQDENISKLPVRWDASSSTVDGEEHDAETTAAPIDQDAYHTAMTRLQSLSAQRLTAMQKLNTYQALLTLLEPYRDPKENVQPNLVWKDAPLAQELGRTRTLAIRVAGRIAEGRGDVLVPSSLEEDQGGQGAEGESGYDKWEGVDTKEKVDRVLAAW